MDVNTILKLIDAGYSKADIESMNAPASTEAPAPVEAPAEEKPAEEKPSEAPAEEKPAVEKPAEAPAMTGDDILQNLLAEVKGLKAQIQSNNIKTDSMTGDDILQNLLAEVKGLKAQIQSNNIKTDSMYVNHAPDLTAEQILASIINPKKEG